MKTKNILKVMIVGLILISCSSTGNVVPTETGIPTITIAPRADNFSFVFEDTPCGSTPMNILDTVSNTLIHTPIGDSTSITISLRLTNEELESIYQKAMSIRFFYYPSEFIIPDDQIIGYHSPASSYKLEIINGEMTNSVEWHDDTMTKPSYTKADHLRELINFIEEIIQSHPEIKQLPEPNAGCV